jgi:phenylacetate-CoA ligase
MTPALPRTLALALVTREPTDRAVLEQQRTAALRQLLAHAEQHVSFVARRMRDAGIAAADIRSVRDLAVVPVATKRDYQEAGLREILARDVSPAALVDRSTSGSTGERMIVKRTWAEERLLNAFRWRALRSCGHRVHHRRAVMRFRLTERPRDEPLAIRLARRSGIFPRRVFDGLAPQADVASVAAFAPQTVSGMTSVVARLADAAAAGHLHLRPRLVVTGGELMTAPLRARIALLGGEVRDFYGCNELNLIAWQCPAGAGTYHVCDDAHVIEVLGADGREVAIGEQGEVVATSLFSWAMPILRYHVGDVAVRGPDGCPCGAVCSTLLAVCGRTIDDFDLGCGDVLHPWQILNVVRPRLGWVRQLQLVQQSRGALVLRVIPLREPAPAEIAQIEASARAALGGRARFAVELVDAIAPDPSGKLRPFVPLSAASSATS